MPRPVHFEVRASDTQRAINFYSKIFGWQFMEYMPGVYWLITTGDKETLGIDGGLGKHEGPLAPKGSSSNAFICTIDVPNIDETIAAVQSEGCEIVYPKHAIPSVGWLVYFLDPEGNTVGAMEADTSAA